MLHCFSFSLNSYFHYTYSNELSLYFFLFKVFLLIFNVIMNILLCWSFYYINISFPGGSMVKNPSANARDTGSIPGSGRSSGERNGNPLQYSCLGNPMHREGWQAIVDGVAKSRTQLTKHNVKKLVCFPPPSVQDMAGVI